MQSDGIQRPLHSCIWCDQPYQHCCTGNGLIRHAPKVKRESRTEGFVPRSDSILTTLGHPSYGLLGKDCHVSVKGKYHVWTWLQLERYVHDASGHWYVEACGLAAQAEVGARMKPSLCATLLSSRASLEYWTPVWYKSGMDRPSACWFLHTNHYCASQTCMWEGFGPHAKWRLVDHEQGWLFWLKRS